VPGVTSRCIRSRAGRSRVMTAPHTHSVSACGPQPIARAEGSGRD